MNDEEYEDRLAYIVDLFEILDEELTTAISQSTLHYDALCPLLCKDDLKFVFRACAEYGRILHEKGFRVHLVPGWIGEMSFTESAPNVFSYHLEMEDILETVSQSLYLSDRELIQSMISCGIKIIVEWDEDIGVRAINISETIEDVNVDWVMDAVEEGEDDWDDEDLTIFFLPDD